jgi:hypothetical protein
LARFIIKGLEHRQSEVDALLKRHKDLFLSRLTRSVVDDAFAHDVHTRRADEELLSVLKKMKAEGVH